MTATDPAGLTDTQATAWDAYLADTADAREWYGKLIDEAHTAFEQVKAKAEAAHRAVDREAWEHYQAACCAAWHDYESRTRDAAIRRQLATDHEASQAALP